MVHVGIDVQHFHSEGHISQYEIATGPLSPVRAIDKLVLSHEIIRDVLVRHGQRAMFHPKPIISGPANGAHFHISMEPSLQEDHFTAGSWQPVWPWRALGNPGLVRSELVRTVPQPVGTQHQAHITTHFLTVLIAICPSSLIDSS
jgi:Glutamine synthetase, catalytic domain